jgi:hypothetical protein
VFEVEIPESGVADAVWGRRSCVCVGDGVTMAAFPPSATPPPSVGFGGAGDRASAASRDACDAYCLVTRRGDCCGDCLGDCLGEPVARRCRAASLATLPSTAPSEELGGRVFGVLVLASGEDGSTPWSGPLGSGALGGSDDALVTLVFAFFSFFLDALLSFRRPNNHDIPPCTEPCVYSIRERSTGDGQAGGLEGVSECMLVVVWSETAISALCHPTHTAARPSCQAHGRGVESRHRPPTQYA